MREKLLVINDCEQCPYFDNEYWDYAHTCKKLERVIEHDWTEGYTGYIIPDDCPLEDKEI